jgi:hypothetical protein
VNQGYSVSVREKVVLIEEIIRYMQGVRVRARSIDKRIRMRGLI